MLYSFKNQYPGPLPYRIRLSNGTTRTDPSTFKEEEILDAGYVLVENPPIANFPNTISWNGSNWQIDEPDKGAIDNQKEIIKTECQKRLTETDYRILKSVEMGLPMDQSYVIYRQQLRGLYNSVNEIDIWNISWPSPYKTEIDPNTTNEC